MSPSMLESSLESITCPSWRDPITSHVYSSQVVGYFVMIFVKVGPLRKFEFQVHHYQTRLINLPRRYHIILDDQLLSRIEMTYLQQ